jgi:hypothetical protein
MCITDNWLVTAVTLTNENPVLSSERAPHMDKNRNCLTVTNIWSWAQVGFGTKTDWPTIGRNVSLILTWLGLPPAFTPVSLLAYSTLKMEEICSSETSVHFQRTTRRYIPQESTLDTAYFALLTMPLMETVSVCRTGRFQSALQKQITSEMRWDTIDPSTYPQRIHTDVEATQQGVTGWPTQQTTGIITLLHDTALRIMRSFIISTFHLTWLLQHWLDGRDT